MQYDFNLLCYELFKDSKTIIILKSFPLFSYYCLENVFKFLIESWHETGNWKKITLVSFKYPYGFFYMSFGTNFVTP
jgi:hypothetical protein